MDHSYVEWFLIGMGKAAVGILSRLPFQLRDAHRQVWCILEVVWGSFLPAA